MSDNSNYPADRTGVLLIDPYNDFLTLVRDATAAFSPEAMHAAHVINGPTYAHAIVDTRELLAAFPQ